MTIQKFTAILTLLLPPLAGRAGVGLDSLFTLIEQNNPSLCTYEAQCRAAKTEARLGLAIAPPEVEFGYLWGTPANIGTRKDFSFTQSVPLATLFGLRRREVRSHDELADLQYQQAKNLLFFSAEQLYIRLVHANLVVQEQQARLQTAQQLTAAYQQMLAAGEVSKPDLTRVQLAQATAEQDLHEARAAHEELALQLESFCNHPLPSSLLSASNFPTSSSRLPFSLRTAATVPFDSIEGHSPRDLSLLLSQQQQTVAAEEHRMAKAERWPELTAGYMSELTHDEKWRGLTVGLSIPLWGNRRNLQNARAQQQLAHAQHEEQKQALQAQRTQLQAKQQSLAEQLALLQDYRTANPQLSILNTRLLQQGAISLPDYLQDRAAYYDLRDRYLQLTLAYHLTHSQLRFLGE